MQSSSCLPCASMSTLGLLSCRGSANEACSASGATMKTSAICASSGNGSLSCGSSSNNGMRETNFLHMRGAARWSDTCTSSSRGRCRRRWRASIAEQELAQKAKYEQDAKVIQIHTVKQFEEAVAGAGSKLVVVEYAASTSPNSRRIYPSMVELSLTCQDAVFLLVMGDESGETGELCRRAGVQKVPHFVFYKGGEVVHEEEGMVGGPDQLLGDVLYYGGGGADNPITQLHSKKELEDLVALHASDGKLLVLDVGLKHCGPCVKVYPTFVKLAKKMRETAVFARINGDENDELMELLRQMDVVEVPTFVFIRDGSVCGRYVGSGKGELIGEILRHQGVRVTY